MRAVRLRLARFYGSGFKDEDFGFLVLEFCGLGFLLSRTPVSCSVDFWQSVYIRLLVATLVFKNFVLLRVLLRSAVQLFVYGPVLLAARVLPRILESKFEVGGCMFRFHVSINICRYIHTCARAYIYAYIPT